jgi:uncharacterized protein
MKFVLWALLVVAIVWWLSRSKKIASGNRAAADKHRSDGAESMVRCAHCGVHLPASESVAAPSGAVFCCEEHRLRHAAS